VFAPEVPPPLAGLSPSFPLADFGARGLVLTLVVLAELSAPLLLLGPLILAVAIEVESDREEFLRDPTLEFPPFLGRVLDDPTGRLAPEPLFLFLMTSVFKLNGLTTPWSFKNKPHALHNG
jgi:hypothetical protein